MRRFMALVVAASVCATAGGAFAQDHDNNARCPGQRGTGVSTADTTYCFDGENVPGGIVGPGGVPSRVLHPEHGPSLIRWRAHFVPEMLKSVETI